MSRIKNSVLELKMAGRFLISITVKRTIYFFFRCRIYSSTSSSYEKIIYQDFDDFDRIVQDLDKFAGPVS
jgi:hypothetical protein